MAEQMLTYTKKRFSPLTPTVDDIQIEDIAHALSLMCRANGQFPTFYSVGQHSIACAEEAVARGYSPKVALACLLHDGSEAYIADIIRPIKYHMPQYLEIETVLQNCIYNKYIGEAFTEEEEEQIKSVDNTMLFNEFKYIANEVFEMEVAEMISNPDFAFKSFQETEDKFIALFEEIIAKTTNISPSKEQA